MLGGLVTALIVQLTREEFREHLETAPPRVTRSGFQFVPLTIVLWAIGGFLFVAFFGPLDRSHVALFVILVIVVVVDRASDSWRIRRQLLNDEFNPALREWHYRFDESGISFSSGYSDGHVKWPGIFNVDETKNLFRFFIGSYEAMLVPKRVLENEDQFRESVKVWRGAA